MYAMLWKLYYELKMITVIGVCWFLMQKYFQHLRKQFVTTCFLFHLVQLNLKFGDRVAHLTIIARNGTQ